MCFTGKPAWKLQPDGENVFAAVAGGTPESENDAKYLERL